MNPALDVLVVPAMPPHGAPAVSLAEALACPGLRGYDLLRNVWPSVHVVLAVPSLGTVCAEKGKGALLDLRKSGIDWDEQVGPEDRTAVRELAAKLGAQEIWNLPGGSGPMLLESLASEAGRRMGADARLAVSSPWCVLAGDAHGAAESVLERFDSGIAAVVTCREVDPHPSVYRVVRHLEGRVVTWRAYAYAGAFSYSLPHGGFIDLQEKPLIRRQDFPPLYELDYGLAAGTAAGLAALQSRMEEQPDVIGPSHDSILLMGLLDVARAEVLQGG